MILTLCSIVYTMLYIRNLKLDNKKKIFFERKITSFKQIKR